MFLRGILAFFLLLGWGNARAGWFDFFKRPDSTASKPEKLSYEKHIKPLVTRYCYDCHGDGMKKGGLALDSYPDAAAMSRDLKTWETVLNNLRNRVMPPEKKPQPSQTERDLLAVWIERVVFQCDCDHPDPGRVTLRRLNRTEYNNTIRDLVGVNFRPADDFPADDSGYGFDNIGDVLSLPPILLEKYLAAAGHVLDTAIVTGFSTNGPVRRFAAASLQSSDTGGPYGNRGARILNREGEVFTRFKFPREGEYIFRARAFGQQAGPDPARMEFRLDGKPFKVFDVPAVESAPQVYEFKMKMPAGEHLLAAAYINNYFNAKEPDPRRRDRNLIIESLEVAGPSGAQPLPETHRRIFTRQPTPATKRECAREIIGNFARRAYRRPVAAEEVDRLMNLFDEADKGGETFESSIKVPLQAVLVSPHFLFRGELQPEPDNPKSVHFINEYALASRLSYFLWSSLPDTELFAQAEQGTLRNNLETQMRRMLADTRAQGLVESFAAQWLQFRDLSLVSPDKDVFPDFDEPLRAAMQKETELFFKNIMREDRSLLDFIDADYTFVNERLARHYGIAGVKGDQFQRVSLKGTPRRGVLTQASVLTITSNPTRTSPVKRGKWILENILGTPPPPPPPDVPDLKDEKQERLTGTLRQRMEKHRADPGCAACHARMDPIGFGFENFDGIGGWRTTDENFPIDPTGKLVSGESFKGAGDLTVILKKRKDEFARCLSEKMLTYALGRGLEFYDKCAIEQIAKGLAKNNYKFSALMLEVVKSVPFQKRRGEGDRFTLASP